MSKKKISNILKISILTLLIILGTVGSTYAYQSTDGFLFRDANGNLTSHSYSGAPDLNPEAIGFSSLESVSNGILCDQLGHELKDSKLSDPDPNGFTMPDDGIYPENVTSRYIYDNVYSSGATMAEAFILAQIPEGGVISHWARPSQWAWWSHGSVGGAGNGSASISRVLGALDFENVNTPFTELYNFNNLLGEEVKYDATLVEKLKGQLKDNYSKLNLSEDDEKALNNSGIKDPAELWLYLRGEKTFANIDDNGNTVTPVLKLNMDQNKLDSIESAIYDSSFTNNAFVDANGESVYGVELDINSEENKKALDESAITSVRANDYNTFNSTYLDKDNLKDQYKSKIDSKNAKAVYNEEYEAWIVGPITITYLDYTSAGSRFAGITEHHLDGKYRNDDNTKALTYMPKANIDGLEASQYTFVTDQLGKFTNTYYNYPTSGVPFYIAIGYDENLEQITNFGFTDEYMIATSEGYKVYSDGHYVNYTWKTTISGVTLVDPGMYDAQKMREDLYKNYKTGNSYYGSAYLWGPVEKRSFSSGAIPDFTVENTYCASRDTAIELLEKNSKYIEWCNREMPSSDYVYEGNGGWATFGGEIPDKDIKTAAYRYKTNYVRNTTKPTVKTIEWKCEATPNATVGDAQDLIQAGKSTIKYGKSSDEIALPWTAQVTVEKAVEDESGKEISADQDFYFEISKDLDNNSDGKVNANALYQISAKAGESAQVEVSSDVIIGGYYVTETDEHHLSYADWIAAGRPSESLWNNYTPKDGIEVDGQKYLGVYQSNNDKFYHITNVKTPNVAPINVYKKVPHGTANDNDRFYFNVRIYKDGETNPVRQDRFSVTTTGKCDNNTVTVSTYQEGNYDIILASVEKFVWYDDSTYHVEIEETDDEENTYSVYQSKLENNESVSVSSIWKKFHPNSTTGTIGELTSGQTYDAVIENQPNDIDIDLNIEKINSVDLDSKEDAIIYVAIEEWYQHDGDWSVRSVDYQTLVAKTNSGIKQEYKYHINNPKQGSYYFVKISEKLSTKYSWKNFDVDDPNFSTFEMNTDVGWLLEAIKDENKDKWIIYRDDTGRILSASKMITTEHGSNNVISAVIDNGTNEESYWTGFSINKEILNYNLEQPQNREFYFQVGTEKNGSFKNMTREFFFRDHGETDYNNEYNYIAVGYNADFGGYIKDSYAIQWPFSTDSEIITLKEVDQYGVEYPGETMLNTLVSDSDKTKFEEEGIEWKGHSIWFDYLPLNSNSTMTLNKNDYSTPYAVSDAISNNELTFDVDNAIRYNGKIVIEKYLTEPAGEDNTFYFRVDSINDTYEIIDSTKTPYDYFNANDVVTLKDGSKAVKLVVKEGDNYASVTSNEVAWNSNMENPKMRIIEVDQYNQAYPGSAQNISHADSLWHKYYPAEMEVNEKTEKDYPDGINSKTESVLGKTSASWEGEIFPNSSEPNNCKLVVEFVNRPENKGTGNIYLTKRVINPDTGLQEKPEDSEIFGYRLEITSNKVEEHNFTIERVELSKDNEWKYEKDFDFELEENEVITVRAIEIDENNESYVPGTEYEEGTLWTKFKPTDNHEKNGGNGVVISEVAWNGSEHVTATLLGTNEKLQPVPHKLTIKKFIGGKPVKNDDKFYFKVTDDDTSKDVTKELFGTDYVVIDKDHQSRTSKEIEGKHTYTITEYDHENGISWQQYLDQKQYYESEGIDEEVSDFWGVKYVPEDPDAVWSVSINEASAEEVVVKAYNDEIINPSNVSLEITKWIADLNTNEVTVLPEDSPEFKFRVYLKNYVNRIVTIDAFDYSMQTTIKDIDPNSAEAKAGYEGYVDIPAFRVLAGNASKSIKLNNIKIRKDSELGYKVVEEKSNSFKPVNIESEDGSASAKDGVYEGTLSDKDNQSFETVNFYNGFRIVNINLEKIVYDGDGNKVPIEPNEAFVFEVIYNDDESTKQTVVIDYDNPTWSDTLVLDLDEEATYKVTEVGAYVDYDVNGLDGENVLGTVFVPVNGKDTIEGTVGKDTSGNIDLQGENALVPYTVLPIEKTISDESDPILDGNETFYFKVKSEDGKLDYTKLFGGENAKDSEDEDQNYVIKVKANEYGEFRWLSNPTPWVGLNNEITKTPIKEWLTKEHKVKLIEVDQFGAEYPNDGKLDKLNENSIWNNFKPVTISPEVYTLPIYGSENKADVEFENVLVEMQEEENLTDGLAVKVENAQKLKGHITVGKAVEGEYDENDEFYFKITKLNGSEDNYEWLKDDLVAEYFKGIDGVKTVKAKENDNVTLLVLKANQEVTSKDIEWYSNEHNPQFVLSEVDQYGEMWCCSESNVTHSDSTWFKYQPVRNKDYSTITAQLIAGKNYEFKYEFDELFKNKRVDRHVNLTKVVQNGKFEGPYYFKVTENEKEVKDLFNLNEKGLIEVTTPDAIKSNSVYGTHTYKFTECDENGVTYAQYLKGTKSDFWNEYVPNLSYQTPGVWTVTVNEENPEVKLKASNLKVVTGLRVEKDAETDEEFTGKLTIIPNIKYSTLYIKDSKTNKFVQSSGKTYDITFSKTKPFVLEDSITWIGDAPIWYVTENTDNKSWKLEGYKVNGAEEYSDINYANVKADPSENENKIVIKNTKLDNVSLQINKERRNTPNNTVSTAIIDDSKDYTYDVEIYLKNYVEGSTYTLVHGLGDNAVISEPLEISAVPETAKYGKDYTGYIKTTVTINAGNSQGTVFVKDITVEDGKELGYKVVEVDKDGYSFEDKDKSTDTLWNKTKPTINNQEGTVSSEKAKQGIAKVIEIENAYKRIILNLKKLEDNGPIKEDEVFYYDLTVKSSNGNVDESYTKANNNQIVLDYDNQSWYKEYVLDLDETLTYDIVETDGNGDSYENRKENSDTWNVFKPADGKGEFHDTIENDKDLSVAIVGLNESIKYTFLPIEKIISAKSTPIISENTKFYFKVKSIQGDKDYTELFSNVDAQKAENGKVIEVSRNENGEFKTLTNIAKWEEENKSDVQIIEVDQYGDTEAIEKDSIFKDFKRLDKNTTYELTIYDNKESAEKAHDATIKYIAGKEELTSEENANVISKEDFAKVENAQKLKGQISITKTVNGNSDEDDRFYFTITGLTVNKNDKWSKVNFVEKYFSKYETKEVDGKLLLVLKAGEKATSDTITWWSNEIAPQFELSEVDQYGEKWNGDISKVTHDDSTWFKYQPSAKAKATVKLALKAEKEYKYGYTFKNDKISRNITLVKEIIDGEFKGPYYFKVTEDGKETDLFTVNADGYIEINSKDGITSKDIYGAHKYVITEYAKEGNEYVTYKEFKDGKASEFWATRYVPENEGVWNISLDKENASRKFVLKNTSIDSHTAGFRILKDVVNEEENEVDTHKDTEFSVTYKIVPSKGTKAIFLRNKEGKLVQSNKGETKTVTISESKPYDEHKYVPDGNNYITWVGEAPKLVVVEKGSEDWILVGYAKLEEGKNVEFKENNTFALEAKAENAIVVGNEGGGTVLEEVKFQVRKTVVDLQGKELKLQVNSPVFYFDIYLDNIVDFKNDTYTLESAEGKPYAVDTENGITYTKYIRVPVQVEKGKSSKDVTIDGIQIEKDSKVKYKVVEADENGYSYADREKSTDTLWNKTKPTTVADKKAGREDGIWTGTLSKETSLSDEAKVSAYNIIRQVKVEFEKLVVDENGNSVGIQPGEVFHFIVEYTNHKDLNKNTFDITSKNKKYVQWIILDLDEKEEVKITEVDGNHHDTYENRKEDSDIWNDFAPSNGTGIYGSPIEKDVDGTIELKGTNIKTEKTLYGRLAIEKSVVDDSKTNKDEKFKDREFYFTVENASKENVVDSLFKDYTQLKDANNMNVIVVHPGESIYSNVVSWKEGSEAPTYTVYEVDQYGQTQAYFENPDNTVKGKKGNENNEAESIWNEFDANSKDGLTEKLEGYYHEADIVVEEHFTRYHYTNTEKPEYWQLKVVKDQNGGPVEEGENFYIEIAKGKPDAILSKEDLEKVLPDYKNDIVKLGDNYGVHLYYEHDVVQTAEVLDARDTYYVIEVDSQGNSIEKADKESKDAIFKRFTIEDSENGIFKVNSKQNAIVINNIGEDKAEVIVTKELKEGQSTDEVFNFSILVKDENGEFVDAGYTFDLKAGESSDKIEFAWRKDQDNPVIKVVENGDRTPSAIIIDGVEHSADTDTSIKLEADHKYGYTFENDVERTGNIKLSKKYPDDITMTTQAPTYHFQYEYYILNADGTEASHTKTKDIYVKAGETKYTEDFEWNQNQTAYYKVWEVDQTPEAVYVDGNKIEAKVAEGQLKETKDSSVAVTFENDEWLSGGIHALKGIVTQKNQTVLQAIELLPDNYSLNFTLTVKPGKDSMFVYDGKSYPNTENPDGLVLNKSISKDELKKHYSDDNTKGTDITVFDIAENAISWPKGFSEPTYSFSETKDSYFVEEKGTLDNTGALTAGNKALAKIVNLAETTTWDLVITDISGIVWKDVDLPNKTVDGQEAGGHDGKYMGEYNAEYDVEDENGNIVRKKYSDTLIPNGVYVKLARVYYRKDSNGDYQEIYRMYNGEPMLIGYDSNNNTGTLSTERLYFLTNTETTEENGQKVVSAKDYVEVKDGQYSFKDVSVPALTKLESDNGISIDNGWRVRYDVEFYYDGISYEPTNFLVGSNGNVAEYVKEPNDAKFIGDANNNYLGGNSFATEVTETRDAFNNAHDTVGNITPMDKDGNSTGYLGMATVNYEKVNDIDVNGRRIIQSKGNINLNVNSDNFDSDNYKMTKASTANAGIKYMLSNDNDFLYLDLGKADNAALAEFPNAQGTLQLYKQVYEYANHINLGLVDREQANTVIEKSIDSATMIINEKVYTYDFQPTEFKFTLNKLNGNDKKAIMDQLLAMTKENVKKEAENLDRKLNVYESDYYYRTEMYKNTEVYEPLERFYKALHKDNTEKENTESHAVLDNMIKSKELQIYLTYKITLANGSEKYDVKVGAIDDYSESSLEYVDIAQGYIADEVGGMISTELYNDKLNNDGLGGGLYAYIGDKNTDGTPKLTNIFLNRKEYIQDSFLSNEYYNNTQKGLTVTIDGEDRKFDKNTIIPESYNEILLKAGTTQTFYTTYRVADYEKFDGKDLTIGEKRNTAEINNFTAYYKDTDKPAAVIDIASAPGNYNLSNDTYAMTEADTDVAKCMVGFPTSDDDTTPKPRTIKGTAWLDKDQPDQAIGNANLDENDYKLSNVTTKLVEVMDVPVYNDKLELLAVNNHPMYTEYEYYWDDDSVVTNSNGEYSLNTATMNGQQHKGLVAGNYTVRFFYGDKDNVVIQGATKEDKLPTINGMDYKTTAYRVGTYENLRFADPNNDNYINNEWYNGFEQISDNEARDNEARRLFIIGNNQYLTNKNTAVLDVANYSNAEEYAQAKLRGLTNGDAAKDAYAKLTTLEKDTLVKNYEMDYENYKAELFKSPEHPNGSFAYAGIVDANNYTMFADSAKIDVEIKVNDDDNTIKGINLGLEERAKTKIVLDKQIKEITFTSAGNGGKEFFHVAYDIYYGTQKDFKVNGKEVENAELIYDDQRGTQLYVALVLDESSMIGDDILNKANDKVTYDGDYKKLVPGFRYINVDSLTLQGLQVAIKYQLTTINLSEPDTMGEGLAKIMSKESENEQVNELTKAIEILSSPDYTINSEENRLFMKVNDDTDLSKVFNGKAKPYGVFLGHNYYEGANDKAGDELVTTTVMKVVDYVDNDMNFANDSVDPENRNRWILSENGSVLKEYLDANIFENIVEKDKVYNELELPYNNGHIAITNNNEEFVHGLKPLNAIERDAKDSLPIDAQAITYITLSDTKSATDIGDYGVDNYAEILQVMNPVASRDRTVVYGNYDPRLGSTGTTESDETSTEIITLSPPTGNEENERTMATVIGTIVVIAVLAGTGTALGLKISTKKSKKDEE